MRQFSLVTYAGQQWRLYSLSRSYGWIERDSGAYGQWAHIRLLTPVQGKKKA